ncbi:MAG: HEAT repeat domain-containing protein [Nitrospirales bacterium]
MRHLHHRRNPIRIDFFSRLRSPHAEDAGWRAEGTANPSRALSWGWLVMLLTLVQTMTLPCSVLAIDEPLAEPPQSEADRKVLQNIHTILVAGTVQTWLDAPAPPYNVGVTLKLKLEDAGFQVVFHPSQPHDAILHIQYEEIPGGQFRVLEQSTAIRYRMQLMHDRLGEVFSHYFEAEPSAIPLKSLYWDAIGNLEEDPYYCFVGDIIKGHIRQGQNKQDMLLEVLVRPFTSEDLVNSAGARGAAQETIQQRARLNIIEKLGHGVFHTPEAQATLWTMAGKAQPNERGAAITQLGKIGDSSFLAPLAKLLEKEDNQEVRFATEQAMRLIESR